MLREHVVELAVAILRYELSFFYQVNGSSVRAHHGQSGPSPAMAFAYAGLGGRKGQALSLARESTLLLPRKQSEEKSEWD